MKNNGSSLLGKGNKSHKKNGSGKSPKVRFKMKLEAERKERKGKKSTCLFSNLKDLLDK